MSGDRYAGFHLLEPVVKVNVGNRIFRRMIVRVAFASFVILDLNSGRYSLRTEGSLIASSAASDVMRRQFKLIGQDCFSHHFC